MSEDKINKELDGSISNDNPVSDLYEDWFLDYASYVILERAIPSIDDGLKPVQRRILHSMNNIEDGRYNKCANIIGSSMQFHPHGDASIEDALVNLGQKDLLIDTQGNWGDVRTGDKAAGYDETLSTAFLTSNKIASISKSSSVSTMILPISSRDVEVTLTIPGIPFRLSSIL